MSITPRRIAAIIGLVVGLALPGAVRAETVHVAVAANFTAVAEQLAPLFAAETDHHLVYSFGATGQLYAQISQGAPYAVLLAADAARPSRAIAEGFGVAGTQFTYAVGALALYSRSMDVGDGAAVLRSGGFNKLAMADPQSAPYGLAAQQALDRLGLTAALAPKLVIGQNITQTLQFVESGNAEAGFVGLSQVAGKTGIWIVPKGLYEPIAQDAVLLNPGRDSAAARAFLAFLRSETAHRVIEAAGYDFSSGPPQ